MPHKVQKKKETLSHSFDKIDEFVRTEVGQDVL